MIRHITRSVALSVLALAGPALAQVSGQSRSDGHAAAELPPYLQCVPYARAQSGVEIYGDAHEWWDKAEGRYARGNRPKVGAVMAFPAHGTMQLGHVAAVSKVIDPRTVLLRHANWSPINGRRGQIENDVRAIDVSPKNDWSQVRVWYHPIQALGTTVWPVEGFIYSNKARDFGPPVRVASAEPVRPISPKPSAQFQNAFADFGAPPRQPRAAKPSAAASKPARAQAKPANYSKSARQPSDFASIIAKYDR